MSDTSAHQDDDLNGDDLADALDLGIELSDEDRAEAEKMVAHLKEQFGVEDGIVPEAVEPEEPVELEPEEPVEEETVPAAPASEPAVASSTPDVVLIDGREVPVAEARSLIDLRNYLAANPDKATKVRQVIEGTEAPPTPEPAQLPEWMDADDPSQVALWNHLQSLEAKVAGVTQTQAQTLQEQTRARATADANNGIATFRQLHPELSEDDITTLRTHAVSLNIIDGLAATRPGSDAIVKALDMAYWDHPEFRARANATPTPTETKTAKATERKGKLNGLAGTSGSAPRQETPRPITNDRDMKAEAAKWLQEQNVL